MEFYMQVLFSKFDSVMDEGDAFKDASGNTYYYSIRESNYCPEEFLLEDTVGRFVPIPNEQLDNLIDALENYRLTMMNMIAGEIFSHPDSIAIIA